MVSIYLNAYNGLTAVTFQFSRIGNDPGAARLFVHLDEDPDLGEYIDILPVEFDLEHQLRDKWWVVCHNQLFKLLI